jgi:N utilization substance protein B
MGPKARRESERGPGARRRARELAVAALYRADLMGLDEAAAIASMPDLLTLSLEDWAPADREARDFRDEAVAYASRVVAGVCRQQAALDQAIDGLAEDWHVDRLAITDRVILRIAMWELEHDTAPGAAVIDEAVELAKQYGAAESARFVNGILAAHLGSEQPSMPPSATPESNEDSRCAGGLSSPPHGGSGDPPARGNPKSSRESPDEA